VRLTVDRNSCAATGFCARIAPELFELGPADGKSRVIAELVDPGLEETAEEAALSCPTGAVRLDP
jgi:ferredoxin